MIMGASPPHRAERSQKNGPESPGAPIADGLVKGDSFGQVFIHPFDEHNGVVDHHPG